MPFKKGEKHPKQGGYRENAGRPTKKEVAERESLRVAIERKREERAAALADKYLEMAEDDPATMRHLVDKAMPDLKHEEQAGITVNLIQFNSSRHTVQLHAEDVSTPILAGHGDEQEKSDARVKLATWLRPANAVSPESKAGSAPQWPPAAGRHQ
jgi:benzoyl-CoA reductase/2-hydroxyglutaryl-CoA dehydratase subunit BcrC/BadD/HgdB